MRERIGWNAHALIFHAQLCLTVFCGDAQQNSSVLRREFNGIVQQVENNTFEPTGVAAHVKLQNRPEISDVATRIHQDAALTAFTVTEFAGFLERQPEATDARFLVRAQ